MAEPVDNRFSGPKGTLISADKLQALIDAERKVYRDRHPSSYAKYTTENSLLGGVPMTWFRKWHGGFPIFYTTAKGNYVVDVDGNKFVDFCLGDTGAMAGHSPDATVKAVHDRLATFGGATTMMPTDDAAWVANELSRRFGDRYSWSFTLTATDSNRNAIRFARHLTKRPKVLVVSYCYHGTVDESLGIRTPEGKVVRRPGNVGAPVDVALTTRVVEFNDLAQLESELSHGDVACVLMEPAMTNIGVILPEPGYVKGAEALAKKYGSLMIWDETHTQSAGPGGCVKAWNLNPDIITIGKSIAGGIPGGTFGMCRELGTRVIKCVEADITDTGGVGGTLAGNALTLAAMRATLQHVLTDAAFERMIALGKRFYDGVVGVLEKHAVPWSVARLGARVEYLYASPFPKNGTDAAAAHDNLMDTFMHLFMTNRGILITPFHNMALCCPTTTAADVDKHTAVFEEAVLTLKAAASGKCPYAKL